MTTPRHFIASVVPRRILDDSAWLYSDEKCIGQLIVGDGVNSTIIYDIIMLPEPEFARARMHAGMPHVVAPSPHVGETIPVGTVLPDGPARHCSSE